MKCYLCNRPLTDNERNEVIFLNGFEKPILKHYLSCPKPLAWAIENDRINNEKEKE